MKGTTQVELKVTQNVPEHRLLQIVHLRSTHSVYVYASFYMYNAVQKRDGSDDQSLHLASQEAQHHHHMKDQ